MTKVGVLAIQGSFAEHIQAFSKLGIHAIEIRSPSDLSPDIQGLVLPGGESTTMGLFLKNYGFAESITTWWSGQSNKCMWGTCAGLILLADNIVNEKEGGQSKIGGLDILASRNSYGRQRQSSEQTILLKCPKVIGKNSENDEFHGIFIRAPKVVDIGPGVQVLAVKPDSDEVVAVSQGNIMATTFHPELTKDLRFHQFFLHMMTGQQ